MAYHCNPIWPFVVDVLHHLINNRASRGTSAISPYLVGNLHTKISGVVWKDVWDYGYDFRRRKIFGHEVARRDWVCMYAVGF